MADSKNNCVKCLKPKESKSGGFITQFIDVCRCDSLSAEGQFYSVRICPTCAKRISDRKSGSLTQWIFRSDLCSCPRTTEEKSTLSSRQSSVVQKTEVKVPADPVLVNPDEFPTERYQPLAFLGSGGSALVYECLDPILKKRVCLKILRRITGAQVSAFHKEARIISRLEHSNIIKVLDFGPTKSGIPYMVLELIDPPVSLKTYLADHGPLSPAQGIELITQICSALECAHENGIFHRDIKPSNIMLTNLDGGNYGALGAKLIDFGIANQTSDNKEETLAGTPPYIAPEILSGSPFDEKAEVYSLGCVLFEALTGRPPFLGDSALDTMLMHCNSPVPTLSDASEREFAAELELLMSYILAKDPAQRPASMARMREQLDGLLQIQDDARKDIEPVDDTVATTNSYQNMEELRRGSVLNPVVFWLAGVAAVGLFAVTITRLNLVEPKTKPTVKHEVIANPMDQLIKDNRDLMAPSRTQELNVSQGSISGKRAVYLTGTNIKPADVEKLFAKYPNTPCWTIHIPKMTVDLAREFSAPSVQVLWITASTFEPGVLAELRQLTNIRELSLSGMKDLLNTDFKQLGPNKTLHTLSVSGKQITGAVCQHITNLTALKSLHLSNEQINDTDIQSLQTAKRLRKISLYSCRVTQDAGKALANIQSLRILDLRRSKLSEDALAAMSNSPVESIDLSETEIKDDDILTLNKFTKLTQLTLLSCKNLSARGLSNLQSRTLVHIVVPPTLLNDLSVAGLKHCPSLISVKIASPSSEQSKLETERIRALRSIKGLRTLCLHRAYISTECTEILAKWTSLTNIKLTACGFQPGALVKLGSCTNLKSLALNQSRFRVSELLALTPIKSLRIVYIGTFDPKAKPVIAEFKQLRPDCELKVRSFSTVDYVSGEPYSM